MKAIRKSWHLKEAMATLGSGLEGDAPTLLNRFRSELASAETALEKETRDLLTQWKTFKESYSKDELVYSVRGREIRVPLFTESLCHKKIPKVALPVHRPRRNLQVDAAGKPARLFPLHAGVFPLKRVGEDPTRMFAGEGDPARTNRRFKLLSGEYEAKRLSTAFDSARSMATTRTGVRTSTARSGTPASASATLEDMKVLYDGFELCAPSTSVSMTINGPAPMILAMFLNTAIDSAG